MRELTITEVNSVSGGNVGEIIVGGVKLINDLFNTPLLSFPETFGCHRLRKHSSRP